MLWHVRNKIMYVLSSQTVSALTRGLFLCLFPSLLRNSGNKQKITLLWALKQFVTRVHTLFYIYCTYSMISDKARLKVRLWTHNGQCTNELWGVCSENLGGNWLYYNGPTVLSIGRLDNQTVTKWNFVGGYATPYIICMPLSRLLDPFCKDFMSL